MRCLLFIPLLLISTVGCQPQWANVGAPFPLGNTVPLGAIQPQPQPQPAMPMVVGPPVVQIPFAPPPLVGQPIFQQPPLQPTMPQPIFTPGMAPPAPPIQAQPLLSGAISPDFGLPSAPIAPASLPNPMFIPVGHDDVAWEQLADVMSDYFQIANEQRARRTPEIATRGFIVSAPQTGATVLEPHRRDSADEFNRWESTFQTIRRRAAITVDPDANGYLVSVQVDKEIEDVPQPEHATAGQAVMRNDSSLPDRSSYDVSATRGTGRWIHLGRDAVLEQQMLLDLQRRFAGVPQRPGVLPAR